MGGIPLGRLAGFPVSANWSVFVLLWLFAWSLASTLPDTTPGYSAVGYWFAGTAGALVLLGCLLVHELAHAVFARRGGVRVIDVTLWLFGGVTRLAGEAATPRTAFRIAISGPVTSLLLGMFFAAATYGLRGTGGPHIVVGVGWWLAAVNVVLGCFNLLPGAPLDGGRVLKAFLWRRYRDPVRASLGAARAGRMLAFILIAFGLVEFLAGAIVGGVWLAFIGWFIFAASREQEVQSLTRQAIADVRVRDVMTANPDTAPLDITLDAFIQHYLLGHRHSAYPVVDRRGDVIGLITLAQLRRIVPGRRAVTTVGEAAIPMCHVAVASPADNLADVLARLRISCDNRVLVFEGGRLVGIVTSSDLHRLIDVYQLLSPPSHDMSSATARSEPA
ncbi:site-2 protease family protein [Mycolicibacterium goodii]|uniref:site-2 protease family protein n=1 Tax=Mycolicibacterium goodii TaxID=134601 RepID=UPI001BDC0559|nr:site-2 protease family protein [Mycolicibacterium goodii]MBU8831865.1 site-2 protease family protein [Mycolicibacterium goodii]